ncbi:MAG: hypothetical protein GY805_10610 [Chloroflexi bacterium]|nr:hypothetical protein [Chloroflexota bacterium]
MSHFSEVGYGIFSKPYKKDQIVHSHMPTGTQRRQDSIKLLRVRLKQLNAWPAAGDTFLELLDQAKDYGVTLVPTDFDWLAQVADDACKGKDIGSSYPSIFHKLLTFQELRKKFLQLLNLRSATN